MDRVQERKKKKKFKKNNLTVVVNVRVTSVSYAVVIRVVLVQIRYGGTVVASVAFFVGAVLIGIQLIRVRHQRTIVLHNESKLGTCLLCMGT